MTDCHTIRVRVNGREHTLTVEARRTLADMLRHDLGYTGTHLGCEHGVCGACTVLVDGAPARACLSDHHGLQCGFCTPGFLMLAQAYLGEPRDVEPSEAEIREVVASNLCRCTGYQGIVEAVLATARARLATSPSGPARTPGPAGQSGPARPARPARPGSDGG